MHTLDKFIALFEDEADISKTFNEAARYSVDDIGQGFEKILKKSGKELSDVAFAYVSGSYSRGQQTPYSDVDIECFSENITEEYQDTLKWNGLLISLSIYPAGTVRGENDNIIDRSWARSCFRDAKVIYDPQNRFAALKDEYEEQETPTEADINNGMWKNMRKVIEYHRKLLGAIERGDRMMQGFAAARFLESYAVVRNILGQAEISSEKGQFDVLAQVRTADGGNLYANGQQLFDRLDLTACRQLTQPFFKDLAGVLAAVGRGKPAPAP